jgi:hypothetical protein
MGGNTRVFRVVETGRGWHLRLHREGGITQYRLLLFGFL